LLTFDQAESQLRDRILAAEMIAIDGLPLSGKTTLADRLANALGLDVFGFDDFVLPRPQRPVGVEPSYPFPYFRTAEFRDAVRSLKRQGTCSYRPFNWKIGRVDREERVVQRRGPMLVEGCSVLDPELAGLYDLRIFVESDRDTLMAARSVRDGNSDAANWHSLYLPSVDLYLATKPRERADVIVAGRGI
jgi:uridine kinase